MQIILSNEKDFSNENKHHLINLFIILIYLIFLKTRSLKKKKNKEFPYTEVWPYSWYT